MSDAARSVSRVAAMYDIHGNLPALEAVLAEIEREQPDLIVVGGDVAAGPMPRATLDRLMHLPIPARFVRGNADREMIAAFDGVASHAQLPAEARETIDWTTGTLDRVHRDFMAGFVEQVELEVDGLGAVLFVHATPRSDEEVLTAASSDELVRQALAGVGQQIVVCGHTHMQYDRLVDGVRLVNAGSAGMPYGEPGAYWLMLGPEVQLRHTRYDLQAAAALIRACAYPMADDFAENNVLAPPTAAEALAVFAAWPPD